MEDDDTFRLSQSRSICKRRACPWTQKWGKRFETCQEQSSRRQKQNTWQKEKCTRSKTASARHEKKKIINAMLHLVPRL